MYIRYPRLLIRQKNGRYSHSFGINDLLGFCVLWGFVAFVLATVALAHISHAYADGPHISSDVQTITDAPPTYHVTVGWEQETTIEAKIRAAAKLYNVNPDKALAIAKCESQLKPNTRNWQGSTAKGIFQFTDPTWKYIGAKGHQFDVDENIKQFMKWYPKFPSWWACNTIVK